MIFVFGSNESGRHFAGAAKTAQQDHGARLGIGFGPQGKAFAIPTKDWDIKTLPLSAVEHYVKRFIEYAKANHGTFQVTRIGCGLAGFHDDEIAPMFKDAPENCFFDSAWTDYLPGKQFWGSF